MPAQAFWQGVEEFNQQAFYACHDTLEALWMEAAEPDRKFYQGILQIAVGCYHLSNQNWRGAVILLGEGIGRLSNYPAVYEEIHVGKLVDESYALLEALHQSGAENVGEFVQRLQPASSETQAVNNAIYFPKIVRVDASKEHQ